jgi:hypothetical protein
MIKRLMLVFMFVFISCTPVQVEHYGFVSGTWLEDVQTVEEFTTYHEVHQGYNHDELECEHAFEHERDIPTNEVLFYNTIEYSWNTHWGAHTKIHSRPDLETLDYVLQRFQEDIGDGERVTLSDLLKARFSILIEDLSANFEMEPTKKPKSEGYPWLASWKGLTDTFHAQAWKGMVQFWIEPNP